MAHPLDRPVWNALHSRQAHLAIGSGCAVGFERSHGNFIAGEAPTPPTLAAMADLIPEGERASTVEAADWPLPPGTSLVSRASIMQMVAEQVEGGGPAFPFLELGDADAADMLALATLTRPGPFFSRTHALGGFVGVRDEDGRLVAMAGERMKIGAFTEVSAVCTHPNHRGRGLARGLMQIVAGRIAARGEVPWLHTYPDNAGAIALYESLGFRARSEVLYTIMIRG